MDLLPRIWGRNQPNVVYVTNIQFNEDSKMIINLKHIIIPILVVGIMMLAGCSNSNNPIHSAALEGDFDTVKAWVKKGGDVNAKHSVSNGNILSYAVVSRNVELVKFLITKGAQVNQLDSDGTTPLHYASRRGNAEIVKLLCSNDANPNVFAMDYVRRGSQTREWFPYEGTPLYWALAAKKEKEGEKEKKVQALLACGADLSGKYSGGQSLEPIVFAVNSRNVLVTKMLLDAGADVNPSRGTPLHEAVVNDDANMVRLLLQYGANVNRKESYGTSVNLLGWGQSKAMLPEESTPLQLAESEEIKVLLRQHGDKR